MRTIPQIRLRLQQLAKSLACPELAQLAEETKRRPYVRRARNTGRILSPTERDSILSYATTYPNMTYAAIAARFNTNSGRVSEIVAGFRGN